MAKKKKRHDVIIAFARAKGWRVGAEVGVFRGQTLAHLLAAGLKVIAVDLWDALPFTGEGKDMETGHTNYHRWPLAAYEAEVRALAKSYPGRCKIIKADTVEAAKHVADASLDFVFIDASHDTESVMADIKAWVPKLKRKGMLMGHDRSWPSVRRAIDQLVPGYKEETDSVWYIERRNVQF